MMPIRRSLPAILLLATALGGCGREPAPDNGATNAADNAAALPTPTEGAGATGNEAQQGTLIPPAPGEVGGLPDDRAPLNEGAARNPASVEASGNTIQLWGIALSEGRYGDAYRLWQFDGRQSGMSEQQFADSYRKYSEIHVLVGRPVADGPSVVRVPVQVYGRMREGGRPFNLIGQMELARNSGSQPPWLIADSALQPRGTVRVTGLDDEAAAVIPAAFHGRWSRSAATCGKPGDDMRLAVNADSLVFYESVGEVKKVRQLAPDRIELTAQYNGEGDKWSDVATLRLSDEGKTLTIANVKRVRCA